MALRIHRLVLPLRFPEGLSAGEGRNGNQAYIAKDGQDRPILRGTALAGALRHEWAYRFGGNAAVWFGDAAGANGQEVCLDVSSVLRTPDCLLVLGVDLVGVRTHNAINRHTGAVLDGGLFSMEAVPPGTTTQVCLWLHDERDAPAAGKIFLQQLVRLVTDGLTLGGNAARGIGRVELAGPALYMAYDLGNIDDHATYLDENRTWRGGSLPTTGSPLDPAAEAAKGVLAVEIELGIPLGEDLLVADGQGCDFEMEPQRVTAADGKLYWRIPGSSLRGVFRGWFTRLAARQGIPVADSHQRQQERQHTCTALKGDDLAWGFDSESERQHKQSMIVNADGSVNWGVYDTEIDCPIMQLFGSAFGKGRLHIADALSVDPVAKQGNKCAKEEKRAHVAVDRFTGGANEGFFFVNSVLTDTRFRTTITLRDPDKNEVQWLIGTLRALQVGVLRVGSSKAGGRLSLAATPKARGELSDYFKKTDWTEA